MMFRFLQWRSRKRSPSPRPVMLDVETLEIRYGPAPALGLSPAPILSLSALPTNTGQMVELKGSVADANPAGLTVTFSGVACGTTTTDAAGKYDFLTQATGLGMVYATTV